MTEPLMQYLQRYTDVSGSEFERIASKFKERQKKKGSYLLRAGETCREFVLLTEGCVRLFYLPGGQEITVWFGFPDNIGSEVQSFISGRPSKFFVQAIEDTEYLSLSKTAFEGLLNDSPAWATCCRKIWEETIVHVIDRLTAFQSSTAEERYLDLIRDPDYLQTIPQKYLASYLGITPTSLSRLRKNLSR